MDRRSGDAGGVAGAPDREDEALEFVRFCHRRRHVGWPELYDEMCAVAGRGLYRGYGPEDLAAIGIGFSLFQMPSLAGLVARVVAEDAEHRRRLAEGVGTTVVLAGKARRVAAPQVADEPTAVVAAAVTSPGDVTSEPEPSDRSLPEVGALRLAVAAGA